MNKSAPAVDSALSAGLRRYLYTTAGFTGAAIMVIEILGAKMLSPYLGLSHFVWTAQIAITLVALACGYYFGGRLADRSQQLHRLYGCILLAAVYMALTVLVCEPIAYWCLDNCSLALGSLLASGLLFFVPLALLAMTGPFLVRVIASSVIGVGSIVGRLTAISTLGSFVGTLLIGYIMIPLMPNSVTMYSTAAGLFLISVPYFLIYRRQSPGMLVLAFVLVASAGIMIPLSQKKYERVWERFHGNSHFGQLQVVDRRDGSERFYLNDFLTQNTYDPQRKQSMSHFTYMLSGLARVYTTNISDVLCIGLGIGIVPMDFASQGAQVDVVEINPAVVPVATRFFDLQTNKIHLTIDDGRHYLNRCHKKYDSIILDAFIGDSSPSHLLSKEAFASMHRLLRPGGTLVINAFGELEDGKDFFLASLNKTLSQVFAEVRIHTSGDGGMFLVASDRTPLRFLHAPNLTQVHPAAAEETRESYERIAHTSSEHGIVLTDNYNPAEYYDAKNRETVRRHLAESARRM